MKEDKYFDWVDALQNCSLEIKFTDLRHSVKKAVETRRKGLKNPEDRDSLEFTCVNDLKFSVVRKTFGSGCVVFQLDRGENRARVTKSTLNGQLLESFKLTLTLNDEGECKFKIDGKDEFSLWQVERRALEEALFQGFQERKSP